MRQFTEDDNKESIRYRDLVLSIADDFYKIAREKINKEDEKVQWMLLSRTINTIFNHHYGMTLSSVKSEGETHQKE